MRKMFAENLPFVSAEQITVENIVRLGLETGSDLSAMTVHRSLAGTTIDPKSLQLILRGDGATTHSQTGKIGDWVVIREETKEVKFITDEIFKQRFHPIEQK